MKKIISLALVSIFIASCSNARIIPESYIPKIAKIKTLTGQTSDNINLFNYKALKIALENREENKYVYSPLNHYMSLSLLAAVNEKEELLTALNHIALDSLQEEMSELILSTYSNATKKFYLNNALCIVNRNDYNKERVNLIRDNFNSAIFTGKSKDVTENLNNWIAEVTNSDLSYRIDEPLNSGVSLASATFYSDHWRDRFTYANDKFYGKTTKDIRYLEGEQTIEYKRASDYQVGVISLNDSEAVFIMPDNITDFDISNINSSMFDSLELLKTTVRIPMMDFTTTEENYDYINTKLGIKPMYQYDADKILKGSKFDKQEGQSRIIIDNQGIKAISIIVNLATSTAPQYYDIEGFILNKPFYFLLKNQGIITFAGLYQN